MVLLAIAQIVGVGDLFGDADVDVNLDASADPVAMDSPDSGILLYWVWGVCHC